MTLSLQEALAREKMLEDKLVKVKTMISKNIGRSQTDLMRIFEDIKEELMNLYEEREAVVAHQRDDGGTLDKVNKIFITFAFTDFLFVVSANQ